MPWRDVARDTRRQVRAQEVVRVEMAWQMVVDMRINPVVHMPHLTPSLAVAGLVTKNGELAVVGHVVRLATMPWQPLEAPATKAVKPVGQAGRRPQRMPVVL